MQHTRNSAAAALLLGVAPDVRSDTEPGTPSRGGEHDHLRRHLSRTALRLLDAPADDVMQAERRVSRAIAAESAPVVQHLRSASTVGAAAAGGPATAGAPGGGVGADASIVVSGSPGLPSSAAPPAAEGVARTSSAAGGAFPASPAAGATSPLGDGMGLVPPEHAAAARQIAALAGLLKVSPSQGLPAAEAAHRLMVYGANELEHDAAMPLWKLFLSQFLNLIIVLLLVACVVSFALAEVAEGVAILIIVLINASIATWTEYSSGNALAKLRDLSQPFATVLRDGVEMKVATTTIVPGDIVILRMGDVAPGDGRVIESSDLKADEMLLTGESLDVSKNYANDTVGSASVPAKPLSVYMAETATAASNASGKRTPGGGNGAPPGTIATTESLGLTSIGRAQAATARSAMLGGPAVASSETAGPAQPPPAISARGGGPAGGPTPVSGGEGGLTCANEVYSSTTITSGQGRVIITRTGMQTVVGGIARQLQTAKSDRNCLGIERQPMTPLQRKLHQLAILLSTVALISCAAVFVIGLLREYRDPKHPDTSVALTMVLVSVSLAVSAAPEGLPLAQTITLAVGTHEMAKEHALMRHLPSVETLGSTQVVCSDKTGTLTEGKMTALKLYGWSSEYEEGRAAPAMGVKGGVGGDAPTAVTPGRHVDITGRGMVPIGEFVEGGAIICDPDAGLLDPWVRGTLLAVLLNATANLKVVVDERQKDKTRDLTLEETRNFEMHAVQEQFRVEGSGTEAPLIIAAAKAGLFGVQETPLYPDIGTLSTGNPGPDVPFSSKRKMMMTVVQVTDGRLGPITLPPGTQYVVCIKGAPNYVVDQCTGFVDATATVKPFRSAADGRKSIMSAVDELSMQALRVLAVAIKPLRDLPAPSLAEYARLSADDKFGALVGEFQFAGLIGSMDPEREGVEEAIEAARTAGVRTVMITGDYVKTAVAIAKNIDLITVRDDECEVAVDCQALRPYGDEYLPNPDIDELTSRIVVFARARPEDKLVIVKSLQRQGKVTAMTGDGVNDSPALNAADIGVAMGLNGTEVAKGAADMVLLDDDFSTIVIAIRRGRIIFENIRKFITLLLGTNFALILTILGGVAIGLPTVFEPMPILILNVLCDGSIAMAMSVEPGDDDIMLKPPRPPQEPILLTRHWVIIVTHAVVLASCVLGALAVGLYWEVGVVLLADMKPGDAVISRTPLTCFIFNPSGPRTVVTNTTCTAMGIEVARGMAFIAIAFTEIFRGFTARSHMPFYYRMFGNKSLLRAMVFSITVTLLVLLVPGLRDVFGFHWMLWYHWLTALAFVVPTLLADELLKACLRCMDTCRRMYQRIITSFDDIESELRQLRHHMVSLEEKLHLREVRPAHSRPEAQESARLLAVTLSQLRSGLTERISGDVMSQIYALLPTGGDGGGGGSSRRPVGGGSGMVGGSGARGSGAGYMRGGDGGGGGRPARGAGMGNDFFTRRQASIAAARRGSLFPAFGLPVGGVGSPTVDDVYGHLLSRAGGSTTGVARPLPSHLTRQQMRSLQTHLLKTSVGRLRLPSVGGGSDVRRGGRGDGAGGEGGARSGGASGAGGAAGEVDAHAVTVCVSGGPPASLPSLNTVTHRHSMPAHPLPSHLAREYEGPDTIVDPSPSILAAVHDAMGLPAPDGAGQHARTTHGSPADEGGSGAAIAAPTSLSDVTLVHSTGVGAAPGMDAGGNGLVDVTASPVGGGAEDEGMGAINHSVSAHPVLATAPAASGNSGGGTPAGGARRQASRPPGSKREWVDLASSGGSGGKPPAGR